MSLIELMVVVGIIVIGAGIATLSLRTGREQYRADSAARVVEEQLRTARQYAIDQRRVVRLTFTAPGTITTFARNYDPVNKKFLWPQLGQDSISSDFQFDAESGLPNPGPDGFGNGKSAIDFNTNTSLNFWPDGSVQDGDGTVNGVLLSGVVYVAMPGRKGTSRAVSVFGPVGSVHVYQLSGSTWVSK